MSRRIPTKAATGAAAAPPFANSAASASSSPSSERQPAAWWARRLFRLGSLIFALFWVFPRLYTTWDLTKSEILSAEDHQAPYVWRSEEIKVDVERRAAVLQAFKHSYSSYERDAWGLDNYQPIARKGDNMSSKGGIGYFIVDALDSLLVLGMVNEYERAREWVKDLSFDVDDKFHTFEITIRVLGGLLSAYHLSGEDALFREKAVDLADRILPAFDSPSGIPYSFINLHTRVGIPDADNRGWSSAAEAGTLQLEFKYLSEITGNPIYWEKVTKVMEVIHAQPLMDGLVPIFLNPQTGAFVPSEIRLGSRGDSYYEYLLKQWLQTNRTEPLYREMYDTAMGGIKTHLLKTSATKSLMYTTELRPQRTAQGMQYTEVPKQDHLVCFLGGSLLLGVTEGQGRPNPDDFSEADTDEFFAGTSLISTCMDTYYQTKTGLAPEIVMFYNNADEAKANGREWFINSRRPNAPPPLDARNILRPETVESLFIAYRVTGNPIYREWGWNIFQAFEKHCKIPGGGYASILDVDEVPVTYEDRMETFWLSETLKYLYLLFSEEDLIPTRSSIFSTEAHIFPVFTPTVVDTSR